jgi:formylglycine-generating enzyme required for sulfatase activity
MGGTVEDDEEPVRWVTMTKGFYLGVSPVTQAQWVTLMGSHPSHFKGPNRPVETVSWNDCQEFCAQYHAHLKWRVSVRLPKEAEWEYACRAGTTTEYYLGGAISTDLANYNGHFSWNGSPRGKYRKETTDVCSFPPNPWGLFDLHGNVQEWCTDGYADYASGDPTHDPDQEPDELPPNYPRGYRMVRGGSWINEPPRCRAACRTACGPDYRHSTCGFRLCFELV